MERAKATAPKTPDPLALLRAKVQTLRRQVPALAEDDVWRAFLTRVAGGETSTRAMDERRLRGVVEALHEVGAPRAPAKSGGKRSRHAAAPQLSKARAIWIALAEAGVVEDRSDRALSAFIARQTGVEIGRLDARQWNGVIEGLKGWVARKGVALEGG